MTKSISVSESVLKSVCWCVAPGSLGRRRPRVPASAGKGAPAAVPPVPVPETKRQLTSAVRVRQPARGPRLQTQHGDLRWTQEQLGNAKKTAGGIGAVAQQFMFK